MTNKTDKTRTCRYCASPLVTIGNENTHESSRFRCRFCELSFDEEETMMNGERRRQLVRPIISLEDANRPTSELRHLTTYELYALLGEVRRTRGHAYDLHRLAHDTRIESLSEGVDRATADDLKRIVNEAFAEFVYWKRKAYVVENLLIERTGTYPRRITNSFLDKTWDQIVRTYQDTEPMFATIPDHHRFLE